MSDSAYPFQISTGSATPIYRQLYEQAARAVASGRLKQGDRLPSVRDLAARLLVNPNTIARAYADLARDGLIESQQGRGAFVSERRQIFSNEERRRRLEKALEVFLGEAALLAYGPEEVRKALERGLKGFDGGDGKGKERSDG